MKPTSALPWVAYGASIDTPKPWPLGRTLVTSGTKAGTYSTLTEQDCAYIIHAANLYPRLLMMLDEIQWDGPQGTCPHCGIAADFNVDGSHRPDCELAALLKECDA